MIHCFCMGDRWEIATRSVIGAEYKYDDRKNFKRMFLEAIERTVKDFNVFNERYSYIFILQHPENRIVANFTEPNIVLLKMYESIEGGKREVNFYEREFDEFRSRFNVPRKFNLTTFESIERDVKNISWECPGFMIYSKDGTRTKIMNPSYCNVKKLKGNAKIQYQFYCLRKIKKIKEFLSFYPEYSEDFLEYRDTLYNWTRKLYKYYVELKILKEGSFFDIPYEFRPHVFNLHGIYLRKLLPVGKKINFIEVSNYVNMLEPERIMFAVNYDMRRSKC